MSTKTAKVLHVIAFILIVLTMAFVLVGWLVFKDELMALVNAGAEMTAVNVVPWGLIIEVGFILILALIWLLVLFSKPSRGATIAMTVILSILLIGYFAVGKAFLNAWLQQKTAAEGAVNLAAYSQLNYVMSTIANFAFVPGVVLMSLSLGSACGKNFKPDVEEDPVYKAPETENRPYMQQPQYGQRPGYQQNYGQQSKPQNAGYVPKQDAVTQNTGYIPKADAAQNTGYIPKVDLPQNTGVIPPVKPVQESTGAAGQIIYPWMKAAGAPAQNNVEMSPQKAEEVAELVSETPESGK